MSRSTIWTLTSTERWHPHAVNKTFVDQLDPRGSETTVLIPTLDDEPHVEGLSRSPASLLRRLEREGAVEEPRCGGALKPLVTLDG